MLIMFTKVIFSNDEKEIKQLRLPVLIKLPEVEAYSLFEQQLNFHDLLLLDLENFSMSMGSSFPQLPATHSE